MTRAFLFGVMYYHPRAWLDPKMNEEKDVLNLHTKPALFATSQQTINLKRVFSVFVEAKFNSGSAAQI